MLKLYEVTSFGSWKGERKNEVFGSWKTVTHDDLNYVDITDCEVTQHDSIVDNHKATLRNVYVDLFETHNAKLLNIYQENTDYRRCVDVEQERKDNSNFYGLQIQRANGAIEIVSVEIVEEKDEIQVEKTEEELQIEKEENERLEKREEDSYAKLDDAYAELQRGEIDEDMIDEMHDVHYLDQFSYERQFSPRRRINR